MSDLVSEEIPAVLVAEREGGVIVQNRAARQLMGVAKGRNCWDVVGGMKQAEGLPCATGCVRELLAAGVDRSCHTRFSLAGRRHDLTCVPMDDVVICTLNAEKGTRPDASETLTARELDVLELLADGETTQSAARQLGVRESTLRTHVEKMRFKLGVNTRAAIVALGFRLGYLS